MRIYTKSGDLAFKTFIFPDGQPHIKVETHEIEFRSVTVEMAIRNPTELLQILLVAQVLRQQGYSEINLDIRYLLGARMDRAISPDDPFTLECIARLINGAGFSKVRILDVHSEVATKLIRNSINVLPFKVFDQVCHTLGGPAIVQPDKGAYERVSRLCNYNYAGPIIQCSKVRDMATGALTGFKADISEGPGRCYVPFNALIVDDICDGGGTFVGLAKELRAKGAEKVYLYVTHGIFSKGLPLEGIDQVFTTDSYTDSWWDTRGAVVIPISMKEMK